VSKAAKKGLQSKIKAVSVVSLKKDGEKSFACGQFLENGNYLVGSSSGAIYVGKENTGVLFSFYAFSQLIYLYNCIIYSIGHIRIGTRQSHWGHVHGRG